jgi:hypothetical protein
MKQKIRCKLTGEDGNAYAIMARVKKALELNNIGKEEISLYLRDAILGDYDNLLMESIKYLEKHDIDWE